MRPFGTEPSPGGTCVFPSSTRGLALAPWHGQACHPSYWSGEPLRRAYSLKPRWNTVKNSFTPNREKARVAHRADHPLGELVPESAQHSGGGAGCWRGWGVEARCPPLCRHGRLAAEGDTPRKGSGAAGQPSNPPGTETRMWAPPAVQGVYAATALHTSSHSHSRSP